MAQFRATIRGQRGEASRLGSKNSGMRANVNGWSDGVMVNAYHDSVTGEDVFEIRHTGGSGYSGTNAPVATIRGGKLIVHAAAEVTA